MNNKLIKILFFSCFFIFFIALSFWRFNQLQIFYYDFGIFAHIIHSLSRFRFPYLDHIVLGHIPFLGDHFNPSLVLLAPLFWLTSNLKILSTEQALVTTISGVLIYKISRKHKLSEMSSLAISFTFLIFAGTENPLVSDWHAESTAGSFLLLFYYLFRFTNHTTLSLLSAFIFLGFKESNAFTLSLLLTSLILQRLKPKQSAILITISVIYFLLVTKLAIPIFAGQPSIYYPKLPQSVRELTANIAQPKKIKLVRDSFLSFGILPILSPTSLIPIFGELSVRFIPTDSKFQNLTLGLHYNVYLGIFLALSTIFAIKNIKRLHPKYENLAIVTLLALSLITARKITSSPINLAINPVFWFQIQANQDTFSSLSRLPKSNSTMSQNNLLPHLVTHANNTHLLTRDYQQIKPDLIVIGPHLNQNPNNFWGPDGPASLEDVLAINSQLETNLCYSNISNSFKPLIVFAKLSSCP